MGLRVEGEKKDRGERLRSVVGRGGEKKGDLPKRLPIPISNDRQRKAWELECELCPLSARPGISPITKGTLREE